MARLRGVEPPTSGSGDQRSIQLSYRRIPNQLQLKSLYYFFMFLTIRPHAVLSKRMKEEFNSSLKV